MKVKEIKEMIALQKQLIENKKIASVTYKNNYDYGPEGLFPYIEELNDSLGVIVEEVRKAKQMVKEIPTKMKSMNCNHQVRLKYPEALWTVSECVLCGKRINGDNHSNGGTIYNDVNRNRNCVMFTAKYYDEEYGLVDGYKIEEVIKIMEKIIKNKDDNQDIDFVKEIKKLHLKKVQINDEEKIKEYYVLVIGGSNQISHKNYYITAPSLIDSIEFAKFFLGIPDVNVELFDSEEHLNSIQFKEEFPYTNFSSFRFEGYKTIEALETLLSSEQQVPFDLIIDLSNLNTYEIQNNQIVPQKYHLNLEGRFPNSEIITLEKKNLNGKKEMLEMLRECLLNNKPYDMIDSQKVLKK